jgi:predicted alpha/beta superfamily hydrolase
MKKNLLLLATVLFISSATCFAQSQSEKFEITSNEVKGVTYSIEVVLPDGYDAAKKYPIIYVPDWYQGSNLSISLMSYLRYNVEPVITVGIQDKSTIDEMSFYTNRTRDLTPTNMKTEDSLSHMPAGTSGGAKYYLSFIKNELIPAVEKKYDSDVEKRGYAGISLGGLFGTYILLNEPDLFKKYSIGSPSLWWDDYLLSKELIEMKAESLTSINSIFLAVEEEGAHLRGYEDLKMQILQKKTDALKFETVIIIGENHMTAVPSELIKGFKFLYGN